MTDQHKNQDQQEHLVGEFRVSGQAVERSMIGGPEDIYELATVHWKSIVVVLAFLALFKYQGRIDVLEDEVTSLRNIYAGLPEEKALAVGALRSVEDLRGALTILLEERIVELIETDGLLRGGTKVARRLSDLSEISGGFEKLWGNSASESPAIYKVVDSLQGIIDRGEGASDLVAIREADSKVAFGVSRFLLGQMTAAGLGSGDLAVAVAAMRDAERVLPPSSVVRAELVSIELASGNDAFLKADRERWISTYQRWWPEWEAMLKADDSPEATYRVAKGIAESLVFPLYALNHQGEGGALTVSELERGLGRSLVETIRQGLTRLAEALELNVDRIPVLVIGAKLDLVIAGLLGEQSISEGQQAKIWDVYQSVTGRFQGVPLELATQTLHDGAYRLLDNASSVATSNGERLVLHDLGIGQAVVQLLPKKYSDALGFSSPATE